jgi:hypothetical protein
VQADKPGFPDPQDFLQRSWRLIWPSDEHHPTFSAS